MFDETYSCKSDEALDKLEKVIESIELSEDATDDFSDDPAAYFEKNGIPDIQCRFGKTSLPFSEVVSKAEVPGRVSMARTLVRRLRASDPTMDSELRVVAAAANAVAFANVGYAVNLFVQANALVNTNINNQFVSSPQGESDHLMVDLVGSYKESRVSKTFDALGYSLVRQAAIIKSLIVSNEQDLSEGMHEVDSEWNGMSFVLEFERHENQVSIYDAYLKDVA